MNNKFIKILKDNFWLFFFFVIVLMALTYGVWQQSYSWYFQDETDHLVPAWMTLKYNWLVYKDFTTNHQPIPILYSLFILKLAKFKTLWQLIPQVRLLMLFVSGIFGIFSLLRFRYRGLISWSIFSFLSYYFFGFHVLGEVFAAYAILVITSYWLFTKKVHNLDVILFGLALFFAGFSLLPSIIYLLVVTILFIRKLRRQQVILLLVSVLIPTALLFIYIPFFDWWRETIVYNWKYWLPLKEKTSFWQYIEMVFYPINSLFLASTWSRINLFYFVSLIIMVLPVLDSHDHKLKKFARLMGCLLILGLLNNRVIKADALFYEGFHLLPYLAGFITLLTQQIISNLKNPGLKYLRNGLLIILFLTITPWVVTPTNRLNQYTEHYSSQQNLADILITLKSDGDRFLSGPDGAGYINIVSNLPIAGRQLFHLNWSWEVPALREEFQTLFEKKPPEFVLFYNDGGQHAKYLQPILKAKYLNTYNSSGDITFFFILKEKWSQLSPDQKQVVNQHYLLVPKTKKVKHD